MRNPSALLEGTLQHGTLLIGFERHHRIDRYPIRDGEVQAPTGTLKLPAEAKRMPTNQGIEALAVLKGGPYKGSVVAFAERFTRGSGYHTGWIWVGGGEPQRIQLQDIDGFNITDAAGLPDGSLLVLERYFRWTEGVKMRLRHLRGRRDRARRAHHRPHADRGRSSFEIDNMEGLAVHRGAGGETVVSLISDDNFNHFLQRTVFLQFTLHDADRRAPRRREREMAASRAAHSHPSRARARRPRHDRPSAWGDLRARVRPRHDASSPTWPSRWPIRDARARGDFGSPRRTSAWSARSPWSTPAGRGPAALVPAGARGARHRARPAPARGGAGLRPASAASRASSCGPSPTLRAPAGSTSARASRSPRQRRAHLGRRAHGSAHGTELGALNGPLTPSHGATTRLPPARSAPCSLRA